MVKKEIKNTKYGIYGTYKDDYNNLEKISIANKDEVKIINQLTNKVKYIENCNGKYIYLYDENNQVVSQFDQLLVLPHMQLTLTLDSKDESDLYEFKNTRAYEIDSTKPDFEYTSFTLDGDTNVFVEDEISTDDLEILVRYLYEASQYGMGNLMKSCDVEIWDGSAYEVVIEDGEATVTYLNEDKEAQFSYSFSAD